MNPPSTTAELLVSQFAPVVLLTLKQVSQVTGQAEQTIRNLISQNRTTLPTRKVGGRRVVHVLDLAAWLDEQRMAPDDVPSADPPCRRPGRPTKAEQRRAR
jgi:predicted DNA-binding transcriptional regulator AlpA